MDASFGNNTLRCLERQMARCFMATSVFNHGVCASGDVAVSSAGTAVQLETTATLWNSVVIVAKGNNTGRIFIGGSDVDSSTTRGLAAGDWVSISPPNKAHHVDLSTIYVDASDSGEGVDFYASK